MDIKRMIKESGMTQQFVADALGITRASLSYKLEGTHPFTVAELKKLFKVLNFTDIQILCYMKEA